MTVQPTPKVNLPPAMFRTVAAHLGDAKTRARFMVIASTGVRPAEVKLAEPQDVDLERRLWFVRTAKGGEPRAIWLNEDMFAAWQAFVAAEAWGPFDSSDYAKALYTAGWPRHVRPYNARHAVGIELGERGIDLGDIQGWLGHKHIQTTRKHYVPVLSSRLKQASERTPAPLPPSSTHQPRGRTPAQNVRRPAPRRSRAPLRAASFACGMTC